MAARYSATDSGYFLMPNRAEPRFRRALACSGSDATARRNAATASKPLPRECSADAMLADCTDQAACSSGRHLAGLHAGVWHITLELPCLLGAAAGAALLAEIVDRHGPVLVHQSGGCCDGSSPMVYPRSEFCLGGSDVLLGTIGTTPVYIGAQQFAAWKHTQLILDVVPGRGGPAPAGTAPARRRANSVQARGGRRE